MSLPRLVLAGLLMSFLMCPVEGLVLVDLLDALDDDLLDALDDDTGLEASLGHENDVVFLFFLLHVYKKY